VDILKVFNCFELNDDFVFDEKIEAVLADLMIAVEKREGLLPNERNSANCKFNRQRLLIDGFEKARSKFGMDGNRGDDHLLRNASVPQFHS